MIRKTLLWGFLCFLFYVPVTSTSQAQQDVSLLYLKASSLYDAKDFSHALDAYNAVGVKTERDTSAFGQDTYVMSQLMAILCHENLKQYEEAFQLCEPLMRRNLTEAYRSDVEYLYVYNGYAVALSAIQSEQYAEARDLLNRIEPFANDKMRDSTLSKEALSWYLEGCKYIRSTQFEQAMPCMERAVREYHDIGDMNGEIKALYQLGFLKKETFATMEALEYYNKAARLARKCGYDAQLMSILLELNRLSERIGDMEKAVYYDMQMDSLVALSENLKVKIEYYHYRGKKASNQGQLNLSEYWYKRNEDLIKGLDEEDLATIPPKTLNYNDLSDLYLNLGRYEEALEYERKSLKELQRIPDDTKEHNYHVYLRLADIYCQMKDSVNCFASIDTMFMSLDQLEEPQEISFLYQARARCHRFFKDYVKALDDYREADRILSTQYGPLNESRVNLLALMGGMENRLKLYEESERHYQQYVEGIKTLHGENSVAYANALVYLANAEGFADHLDAGHKDYVLAVEKLRQLIHDRVPYYTSDQRAGFWEPISEAVCNMTPYAVESGEFQTSFTESCYDGLVMTKAFLLSSAQSTFDLIRNNGSAEDIEDFAALVSMKAQLGEWENDYSAHADDILHLTTMAEGLEKRLMGKCRAYGDMTSFINIGYQQIKQQLGDNDVLIDFSDYYLEEKGREYVAYLINKSQSHPLLQVLFDEDTVSFIKAPYLDMFYEEPYAEELYRLLWAPFKGYVQEGATVYYVPSQFLFQFAPESIPLGDGSLLGDHYRFVRLSSAREIMNVTPKLEIKANDRNRYDAVLYGGLKYDITGDIMQAEASQCDIPIMYASTRDMARGDSIFRELPKSQEEIDSIAFVLEGQDAYVKSYSGVKGTEESFVMLSGHAPRVLHLATHGFYYTADSAQDVNYLRGYRDAMMLSGLVMSGGNAAWLGRELPEGVLGGILTANDIAKLDLTGVDLLVLSACHSGRGAVTSEGLYGLQRAFKNAGVQTMIMSLWNVSDEVGKMFMVDFYKQLADPAVGWNKREAFKRAKAHIRQSDEYSEPYYWAGFIMLD